MHRRLLLRIFHITSVLVLLYDLGDCIKSTASEQTSRLSAYEVTVPRRISRQRRDLDDQGKEKVSYVIQAQGEEHVLVLEKNELLLPADFTVFTYDKDGSLITQKPNMQNHCHYRGYVEDIEGSSASLSLCSGLNGRLVMGSSSYGIEPLEGSEEFEHVVYRVEDQDMGPLGCGTTHDHVREHNDTSDADADADTDAANPDQIIGHSPSDVFGETVSHLIRNKRAIMLQTHYVELMLVVDVERFNYNNRNDTYVREEMVQLANHLDSMYQQLNIRVVLVGLEIWTQANPISLDGSAGDVLGRFVDWRKKELLPRIRHDSAQLILKKGFGATVGMAFISAVCSSNHGGGINSFSNHQVAPFASIVAHELGHNLGMNHDDDRQCNCPAKSCIMGSGASGATNFSSCSADDFEKMTLRMGRSCLLNVPRPDEAYTTPYCGNKLVDLGEECDCGSEQECQKDPCCEPKTCKLRSWAQCAYGECCKNCKFLPGGYECRSRSDECDLPEYCNGSSPVCQQDVYVQNGHLCRNGKAYCYNGQCQHYEGQCQALFGPKAKSAPDACFEFVNSKGDRFGNCGYHDRGYRRCETRNAKCGKLQCENVNSGTVFGINPSFIQTPIGSTKCWGVDFMLGPDVPDPGMVGEGTKCGENKVCLNYECKDAAELNYDCNMETKCHGHGVCNSNKNCHCEYGWAPPFCADQGYGGSTDSGPTWDDKDTSTRDGLLVFFFLVLPLLLLGLYVFFRRNELRQRFRRRKRSRGYEAEPVPQDNNRAPPPQRPNPNIVKNGHQAQLLPPEEVVQTSRTTSAPAYAPRPPRPPVKPSPAAANLVPQRPPPPPPV
ncbi:disintegrin and metalloproteinase domain-containing protein 9 isoform X1 [Engraulis encrasicolus]|uniref:disintegrin and metalloproteinase domain-containing protein 9 isoform X1 n=1 Tax=Engraulis encrasicolus TaxID=184585 RepID=UPI002FD47FA6